MTIPFSRELRWWSRGYDDRMKGLSSNSDHIKEENREAWEEGWSEADEIALGSLPGRFDGSETGAAYTVRDSSGRIINP